MELLPVHPHARGERNAPLSWPDALIGSSPRTWGTQDEFDVDMQILRFIPTHVGNAHLRTVAMCVTPVHPHARGERSRIIQSMIATRGSSPRTWGTHF